MTRPDQPELFLKATQSGKPARSGRRSAARRRRRNSLIATRILLALLSSIAIVATHGPSVAADREIGKTTLFARVPAPGQPGALLVDGDTVYVTSAGHAAIRPQPLDDWKVFAFDASTGSQLQDRTVDVPRKRPVSLAGLAGAARDAAGRLYVVDMNARVLRVAPRARTWEVYATIPTFGAADFAVSSPRSAAFDAEGNLYVTDGGLPMIWRIRPGGGEAESWFRDPKLLGHPFHVGLSAILVDRASRRVVFGLCSSRQPEQINGGAIYSLPLDDPSPAQLVELHRYEPSVPFAACPRGFVRGRSGKLYVTLQGANQVQILRRDGSEELRFPSSEDNSKLEVPYNGPAGIGFTGRKTLLVANLKSDAILEAFVGDGPAPMITPRVGRERRR